MIKALSSVRPRRRRSVSRWLESFYREVGFRDEPAGQLCQLLRPLDIGEIVLKQREPLAGFECVDAPLAVLKGVTGVDDTQVLNACSAFFPTSVGRSVESLVDKCSNTCSDFLFVSRCVGGKYRVARSGLFQHLLDFSSLAPTYVGKTRSRSFTNNSASTQVFLLSRHVLGKFGAAHSGVLNTCGVSLSLFGICWGNAESLIRECFNTCSAFLLQRGIKIWGETLSTSLHDLRRGGGSSWTAKRSRRDFQNTAAGLLSLTTNSTQE